MRDTASQHRFKVDTTITHFSTKESRGVTGQVKQRQGTQASLLALRGTARELKLRVTTCTDIGPLKYSFEDG